MNKLLECTKGPWHQDLRTKGVISVRADHYGYITDVETDHFIRHRAKKQLANAALIAAAYDHALIGWAMIHGKTFDTCVMPGKEKSDLLQS